MELLGKNLCSYSPWKVVAGRELDRHTVEKHKNESFNDGAINISLRVLR